MSCRSTQRGGRAAVRATGRAGFPRLRRVLAQAALDQPARALNREVGRRTDVVGIFLNDQGLIHLAGMLCIEQGDEWLVGCGYLLAESISLVLADPEGTPKKIKEEVPELQAA